MKRVRKTMAVLLAVAMVLSTLSFGVVGAANTYSDVSGHWAESYINKWSGRSVINGYEDGTFRPDNNISRAEAAKIIVSAKEAVELSSVTFSDVPEDAWYALYVSRAVAAGYVTGDQEGTFRPEDPITREEACAIIARAYGVEGSANLNFSDAGDISSWAIASVEALVSKGSINGYEDGTFRPQAYITRAEILKILDVTEETATPTRSPGSSGIIYPIGGNGGSGGSGGSGGGGGGGSTAYYTVTFDANGGTISGDDTYSKRVKRNSTLLDFEEEPVWKNHEFMGWYTTESGADSLDEDKYWALGERVTKNMTLYAGWESEGMATVTFDCGNGTVKTEEVLIGETVSKPAEDPVRTGFTFTGWFKDAAGTEAYDFVAEVTGDMTIYAGWTVAEGTENVIAVTAAANEDAEAVPYPQSVLAGEKVSVTVTVSEGKMVDTASVTYKDTTGGDKSIALELDDNNKGSFTVPADVDAVNGMQIVITTKDAPKPTAAPTATAKPTAKPGEPTEKPTTKPTATATAAPDDSKVYEGTSSAQLKIIKDQWATLNGGVITVEKNTDYVLTFWAKGSGAVRPKFVKAALNGDIAQASSARPDGNWKQYTAELNSGDNTELRLQMMCDYWTSVGEMYVDSFSLTKKGDSKNLLENPGFEEGEKVFWSGWGDKIVYISDGSVTPTSAPTATNPPSQGGDEIYEGNGGMKIILEANKYAVSNSSEFTVEPNTDYEVSFMAKGKGHFKTGFVKAGEDNPYVAPDHGVSTTEWKAFKTTINSGDASKVRLQLVTNPWGAVGTVYADNFKVVKAGSSTNLIKNPGFEEGKANWGWNDFFVFLGDATTPTSAPTATNPPSQGGDEVYEGNGALKVNVNTSQGGAVLDHTQAISVKEGETYTVSFMGKGTGALDVRIMENGKTENKLCQIGVSVTEWKEQLSKEYTVPAGVSTISVRFLTNPWNKVGTVYIDNVKLTKKGESTNLLTENPGFEEGETGWRTIKSPFTLVGSGGGTPTSAPTATNPPSQGGDEVYEGHGALKADVNTGQAGAVLDNQTTIAVEAGQKYKLSFMAKGAGAFNIRLMENGEIEKEISNWGTACTDWQEFTFDYEPGAGVTTVSLRFLTNPWNKTGIRYIDNVKFVKEGSSTNLLTENPDFEEGETGWRTIKSPFTLVGSGGGTPTSAPTEDPGAGGDEIYEGNAGMKIILEENAYAVSNSNEFTVEPNTDYEVSFMAKGKGGIITGFVKSGEDNKYVDKQHNINANEWKEIKATINTEDAEKIRLQLITNPWGALGTLYVDNFKVVKAGDSNNLIANPGFEEGKANWGWNNNFVFLGEDPSAVGGETAFEGKNSAKFTIEANQWDALHSNELTVKKNTDYVVTLWAKGSGAIKPKLTDIDDTKTPFVENGGIRPNADWKQYTITLNSGDHEKIHLQLMCDPWTAVGEMYVDNVSLAESGTNENLLTNSSFEEGQDVGWEDWGGFVTFIAGQ